MIPVNSFLILFIGNTLLFFILFCVFNHCSGGAWFTAFYSVAIATVLVAIDALFLWFARYLAQRRRGG